MLLNQIREVGVTYVTQRYLWWGLALLTFMVGPQLILTFRPNRSPMDAAQPMMMVLGMPMLFVVPFLVGHVKVQLAHSRARLTPHFLPAHLIVLGGVLITVFLLYPLLLATMCSFNPLGFIALAIAIGVPAIWGSQLNRLIPIAVSIIAFYSLFTNWGLHWWMIDASAHRIEHACITMVGMALAVAWVWRVSHLTEEMDDFQNVYQGLLARRAGSDAVEQRRNLAIQVGRNRFQTWISDRWHARLGGYYGGSQAGLVRLLHYGFSIIPTEIQSLFMAVMIVCLGVFLGQFSYLAKPGASFGALFFFIQFAILLPGYMAGELLSLRRPRIAFELLLPMSRTQLVDGLLTLAVRNAFVQWLVMNAAISVVVLLVSDEFPIHMAAMYLLLSGTTMFAAMGLSLRISIWPSRVKRFAVMWVAWMAYLVPLFSWWDSRDTFGDWPFVLLAVVLAAAGAGLLFAARRAWLNLELG